MLHCVISTGKRAIKVLRACCTNVVHDLGSAEKLN